jgi:hypothetical protein
VALVAAVRLVEQLVQQLVGRHWMVVSPDYRAPTFF